MPADPKPNQAEIEMARQIVGPECFDSGIIHDNATCEAVRDFTMKIARALASRREAAAKVAEEVRLDAMSIAGRIRNMES